MIRELMSSRRFAPLFWAQFFSALNDNVLKNALVIILLYGAAAGEKHDTKHCKRAGCNAGGHSIGARAGANRNRAHGEQKHRYSEHEPDRAPDELKNAQQVKMRAHGERSDHAA